MIKISDTGKSLIFRILIISTIALAVGLVLHKGFDQRLYYTAGLALGTVFAALKVVLLEYMVKKAIELPPDEARNYARLSYTLRYVLTAGILIAAALVPYFSLFGAVIGILSLQVAAYTVNVNIKRRKE